MKHSEMVVVKILDQPGDSSPCPCLLPTGGPEYFAFIQQKVVSLKAALEKAYPLKTRVTYINLQENPAEQENAEGQLLIHRKFCAPFGDYGKGRLEVQPGREHRHGQADDSRKVGSHPEPHEQDEDNQDRQDGQKD